MAKICYPEAAEHQKRETDIMIRFLAALLLTALAIAPPASAQAPAAATSSFTAPQRAEIVQILRDALKSDPSILRDAITALQQDEGSQQAASTRSAIAANANSLLHTAGDPVAGNPNGSVTLVEFYDVRCPYCRSMLPVLASLLAQDHDIRLVYKDIPILGPGSVIAAKAVLAAQRQGGYGRLQSLLMAGSPDITEAVVRAAAQQAGLDWTRLHADMQDPAIQARIDANLQLAQTLKIDGTPAYVIGDQMFPGALPLGDLQAVVAAARKS
jgi:protein-disulfide isomerase